MGPQYWWPAGSAFDVVVGAYLTQNTAWTNVERAIGNLRNAGVLSVGGIRNTTVEQLEQLVRPAGYFRQKSARLKNFVRHLDENHGGSLEHMLSSPLEQVREELLALNGVGPETADSILLYAGSRDVFVVDAYTRRIFERHRLADPATGYEEIRAAVENALAAEEQVDERPNALASPATGSPSREDLAATKRISPHALSPEIAQAARQLISIHPPSVASAMARSELGRRYNEFHALIVQTGKHFCLKQTPRCESCPLRGLLPKSQR